MKHVYQWAAAFGIGTAATLLSVSHGQDTVILNALFMNQAAYSESDVRAMTASFEKANPAIQVNLEFVPYEALRDKTIAAQASGGYDVVLYDVVWPSEYAANGFIQDVSARIPKSDIAKVFSGAWWMLAPALIVVLGSIGYPMLSAVPELHLEPLDGPQPPLELGRI